MPIVEADEAPRFQRADSELWQSRTRPTRPETSHARPMLRVAAGRLAAARLGARTSVLAPFSALLSTGPETNSSTSCLVSAKVLLAATAASPAVAFAADSTESAGRAFGALGAGLVGAGVGAIAAATATAAPGAASPPPTIAAAPRARTRARARAVAGAPPALTNVDAAATEPVALTRGAAREQGIAVGEPRAAEDEAVEEVVVRYRAQPAPNRIVFLENVDRSDDWWTIPSHEKNVDGVTTKFYYPRGEGAAGGGRGLRELEEAAFEARAMSLAKEPVDSEAWGSVKAAPFEARALQLSTSSAGVKRTGASTHIATNQRLRATVDGDVVLETVQHCDGVRSHRVVRIDQAALSNAPPDLRPYLGVFTSHVEGLNVEEYKEFKNLNLGAMRDATHEKARLAHASYRAKLESALLSHNKKLASDVGWTDEMADATGSQRGVLPDEHPERAYLAHPDCPEAEHARVIAYGHGGTGGRSIDARKDAVCKSNLQPDFNVSVRDRFDASFSAVLRELDESNRSVQKSAESTSI